MRNFSVTDEPAGNSAKRPAAVNASGARPEKRIFVIQEHHASHLHYDFRLESEGVLKSWAIPKQPLQDPTVKRLAIEVEDHPLEYAKFAGRIPQGEYGAGRVAIWDHGTYQLVGNEPHAAISTVKPSGKIELELKGNRLNGRFKLVRTSEAGEKSKWLFIYQAAPSGKADTGSADQLFLKVEGKVLKLGHLSKVMYPISGFTKKNCLNYYRKAAPFMLPHLRIHPVSLKRFPDGVQAESFFEKNASTHRPDWVATTKIGSAVPYVLQDLASLLWAVNLAALEIHTYLSPIGNVNEASVLMLDLDPGPGAGLLDCAWVAVETRKHLRTHGLESLIKTSGSKGLHLVVPLNSGTDYDACREYSRRLAAKLAARYPQRIVSVQKKDLRKNRVLIDWMQNDPKKTTAMVYSLRAVDPPQVSCPVSWAEVEKALRTGNPEGLVISPEAMLKRLEKRGDLFADALTLKQSLPTLT